MGVPSIEEQKDNSLSPKIYQPPSEDMEDIIESPRKKKMFSSSSFFEEPNSIYPTIEEQVELCRKIAESLSDDCNQKSKGSNMFFKRVQKSEKWIVAESNNIEGDLQGSPNDPTKMPYVRPSKGLPKLKLILDPRQIIDMKKLLQDGVDIVEHNAVSPDVCHDIVKDLNSPTGKGAQLFAKRKKKSVEWIVDEDKVKHLLQERYQVDYFDQPQEPLMHPRVKALSEVNSQEVKDSIIRAAEAKVMIYPNAVPHVPVISSFERMESTNRTDSPVLHTPLQSSTYSKSSYLSSSAYKYSIPKGWTTTTTSSSGNLCHSKSMPAISQKRSTTLTPEPFTHENLPSRTFNFNNFNTSPKAWNVGLNTELRPATIRSVRPPSVLLQ